MSTYTSPEPRKPLFTMQIPIFGESSFETLSHALAAQMDAAEAATGISMKHLISEGKSPMETITPIRTWGPAGTLEEPGIMEVHYEIENFPSDMPPDVRDDYMRAVCCRIEDMHKESILSVRHNGRSCGSFHAAFRKLVVRYRPTMVSGGAVLGIVKHALVFVMQQFRKPQQNPPLFFVTAQEGGSTTWQLTPQPVDNGIRIAHVIKRDGPSRTWPSKYYNDAVASNRRVTYTVHGLPDAADDRQKVEKMRRVANTLEKNRPGITRARFTGFRGTDTPHLTVDYSEQDVRSEKSVQEAVEMELNCAFYPLGDLQAAADKVQAGHKQALAEAQRMAEILSDLLVTPPAEAPSASKEAEIPTPANWMASKIAVVKMAGLLHERVLQASKQIEEACGQQVKWPSIDSLKNPLVEMLPEGHPNRNKFPAICVSCTGLYAFGCWDWQTRIPNQHWDCSYAELRMIEKYLTTVINAADIRVELEGLLRRDPPVYLK